MKKFVTGLLFAAAVTAVSSSGAIAATLSAGFDNTFVGDVGVRYRSFQPTGGQEVYVGVPDLGNPSNRVAQEYNWGSGATAFDFTFTIDLNNDVVTSQLPGNPLLSYSYAGSPTINAFNIKSVDRDTAGELWLTNLMVNGTSLGDVTSSSDEGWKDFMVTGLAPSQLFTITGTINRTGTFGSSQESSKIEIVAGSVDTPVVPLPAAAWMLLAGIGGLMVAGRRKTA